jgi:beta-glucosidase
MALDTRFPEGFLWGAATSAYQIEGSPLADGAGPGIWHRFTHSPGLTRYGDTGDVACDHYRRWAEDVELMGALGLGAYRLSLSWSRILPEGRGRVNPKGLDFYARLIDRLLERGIQPSVTLFHWDLPAALDDRGGWPNPDSAGWFADYADVVFRAFADRVPMWSTLNEPWVVTDAGYLFGVNAPGHRNAFEAPIAFHHLLLAHAAAVRVYRALGRGKIGIVVNLEPKDPASDSPEDLAATRRADRYNNWYHLDPVFLGRYPDGMDELFGEAWPAFAPEDVQRIREPVDFVGVNYYTRRVVRPTRTACRSGSARSRWRVPRARRPAGKCSRRGSRARCRRWVRAGPVPLYVTENGAASPIRGRRRPSRRSAAREYYREHLLAVLEAIRRGADVRGYFAWSLLDNFEWSSGYSLRFGLVHVDYATQQRTLKASGEFYREVVRTHGAALATAPNPAA